MSELITSRTELSTYQTEFTQGGYPRGSRYNLVAIVGGNVQVDVCLKLFSDLGRAPRSSRQALNVITQFCHALVHGKQRI